MLLAPLLLSALLGTSAPTPQLSRACVGLSRTPLVSQPPLPSHQDRRSFLVRGAAVASSMLAWSARAEDEKMLWVSGKSDPIRKTSKDKPDGTKKDPKCACRQNHPIRRLILQSVQVPRLPQRLHTQMPGASDGGRAEGARRVS